MITLTTSDQYTGSGSKFLQTHHSSTEKVEELTVYPRRSILSHNSSCSFLNHWFLSSFYGWYRPEWQWDGSQRCHLGVWDDGQRVIRKGFIPFDRCDPLFTPLILSLQEGQEEVPTNLTHEVGVSSLRILLSWFRRPCSKFWPSRRTPSLRRPGSLYLSEVFSFSSPSLVT